MKHLFIFLFLLMSLTAFSQKATYWYNNKYDTVETKAICTDISIVQECFAFTVKDPTNSWLPMEPGWTCLGQYDTVYEVKAYFPRLEKVWRRNSEALSGERPIMAH